MSVGSVNDGGDRLLVLIDGDPAGSRSAASVLEQEGWRFVQYPSCPDPERIQGSPRFVAIDICPNGTPALSTIREARRCYPRTFLVALTAYPSVTLAVQAIRQGADDCMLKPLEPRHLLAVCRAADGDRSVAPTTLPSLARVEWEYLNRVLMMCDGNISSAARTLGIRRSTLQRKLRKYPPSR